MKKLKKGELKSPINEVYCSACQREITNERYIKCLKCRSYQLCLECFSTGQCTELHDVNHKILVVEVDENPIFRKNWTSMEENLLLAAIQSCGIGNWNDISDFVRSKKAEECRTHYMETYIHSPQAPLPIVKVLPPEEIPPPPPFSTASVESAPALSHEKHLAERGKKEKTLPSEISGFMPYRHEFEIELDNDAEMIIGDIKFEQDETESSFFSKVDALVTYNKLLSERHRREKIIEEWDIHEKDVNISLVKEGEIDPRYLQGTSPSEKAIDKKILPIAQFFGHDRTLELAQLLHKKLQLQNAIAMRLEWQKQGIKNHSQGYLFNQLNQLIKFGRISPQDIDVWNKTIQAYNAEEKINRNSHNKFLSQPEIELCNNNGIDYDFYMGMKNIMIRECTVRGKLSKEEALNFAPEYRDHIIIIYDFFLSSGWIFT